MESIHSIIRSIYADTLNALIFANQLWMIKCNQYLPTTMSSMVTGWLMISTVRTLLVKCLLPIPTALKKHPIITMMSNSRLVYQHPLSNKQKDSCKVPLLVSCTLIVSTVPFMGVNGIPHLAHAYSLQVAF